MITAESIVKQLKNLGSKQTAVHSQRFFRTGPGEYGEGDLFLGIRVPVLRTLARRHRSADITQICHCLQSPYQWAKSPSLWDRRIAIISTYHFIRARDYDDALRLSQLLLNDNQDLIHKAVGWMLREIGKRDLAIEEQFLASVYQQMPRTMLRYAIEKFTEPRRKQYLIGTI